MALLSEVVDESAVPIETLRDFEDFYASLAPVEGRWSFRGHADADWHLETSLHRATKMNRDCARAESFFVRAFRRRAHHFIDDLPAHGDHLEWLALMQHFGVPTRLLDFTASPYVALYFALNEFPLEVNANRPVRRAALWAVNHVICKGIAVEAINQAKIGGLRQITDSSNLGDREFFGDCFLSQHGLRFVAPAQPFRINQRQSVQQGMFLCPSDVSRSFEEILVQPETFHEYLQTGTDPTESDVREQYKKKLETIVRKAVISLNGAKEILRRLASMNITSASLFPGLEGYSRSIVERYRVLQLLSPFEKNVVGFQALEEFDSLG
jgi:hypothetical protein